MSCEPVCDGCEFLHKFYVTESGRQVSTPCGCSCHSRSVIERVEAERFLQNELWGQQEHEPCAYMAILTEEVGEAAKEAVEWTFQGAGDGGLARLSRELVQVAAVAIAMAEAVERRRAQA